MSDRHLSRARTQARARAQVFRALAPTATLSSMLALSSALATPAQAQLVSYNAGSPTVASGNVTIGSAGTTDTFTVSSPTAVLNFTPTDTGGGAGSPVLFQKAGTTALYRSAPGGPEFTVLNRIVPSDATRPIEFNGTVLSQLVSATGTAARGGSVWFYSPGGIILANGAVFDVGNLLLATADPTGGSGTIGSTTSFTLNGAAGSTAGIHVNPGATINAANAGSYVALVAPSVLQEGRININGSAAFVAAEGATLTFGNGLFDISVSTGSDQALTHPGTTRFLDTATPDRAYLVAVPKNVANTLVIAGGADIGFDIATTVGVENGIVVLASGMNVLDRSNGNLLPAFDNYDLTAFQSSVGTAAANVSVVGGTFNAGLAVQARTQADLIVNSSASIARDLFVYGGSVARVGANNAGTTLAIGGNARVSTKDFFVNSADPVTGGSTLLTAQNGGAVTISGSLTMGHRDGMSYLPTSTGAVTGGISSIEALGGNIAIGGNATLSVNAISASLATGGSGSVLVGTGRTLSIGGDLRIFNFANGFGTQLTFLPPGAADAVGAFGNAVGGNARVESSGTLEVAGRLFVEVGANGGDSTATSSVRPGTGQGGTALVSINAGTATIGRDLTINASAQGGNSANGAAPAALSTGGNAMLSVTGGAKITVGGITAVQAFVTGSSAIAGGTAGNSVAGQTSISAAGDAQLTFNGKVSIESSGIGGRNLPSGRGGDMQGGTADLLIDGASVAINGDLLINANGPGGEGFQNGTGTGGIARLAVSALGGSLTANGVLLLGSGLSGPFDGVSTGASSGSGFGGKAQFLLADTTQSTTVKVGSLQVQAAGFIPNGLPSASPLAGSAHGGEVSVRIGSGTSLTAAATSFAAFGQSIATTGSGAGGSSIGGTSLVTVLGTAQLASLTVLSYGNGARSEGGNGGNGQGGTATIDIAGTGRLTAAGQLVITSSGIGGAAPQATGGSGVGGSATIRVTGGDAFISGSAFGVFAGGSGGIGSTSHNGTGTGGTITVGKIIGTTRIDLSSSGPLVLNGALTAPEINLVSTDLIIASGGSVGDANTQTLRLVDLGIAPLTLGGSGSGPGYTLDQTEFGRLKAGNISLTRQNPVIQDDYQAVLRDFTLNGAAAGQQANLTSATGVFTLDVPGSILVTGNVRLANAEAGNGLAFEASESFNLLTDAGSVGVFGAGGVLGGRLTIHANDISVADNALFEMGDDIGFADLDPDDLSASEIAQIRAAIDVPSTTSKPDGSLQADQIDLAARSFIVIQNSGTRTLPAGFRAGAGGLTITNQQTETPIFPLVLAINGQIGGTGTEAPSNVQTLKAIRFRGADQQTEALSAFADLSTVNGCFVHGCGNDEVVEISAVIAELVASAQNVATKHIEYHVTPVINAAPLDIIPVISSPVTSGGNPSLWDSGEPSTQTQEEGRQP